jgi:heme/copper-type cytochrome/quinol oxidase subunit 1
MLWLGYCGMPRRVLDYPSSLGGWHSISSAGHLLSVAALLSFFIMMYDSIRQAKPAVRNTFGVGRFNTRLNFYMFEINRVSFIQRKNFYNHRFTRPLSPNTVQVPQLQLLCLKWYENNVLSNDNNCNWGTWTVLGDKGRVNRWL